MPTTYAVSFRAGRPAQDGGQLACDAVHCRLHPTGGMTAARTEVTDEVPAARCDPGAIARAAYARILAGSAAIQSVRLLRRTDGDRARPVRTDDALPRVSAASARDRARGGAVAADPCFGRSAAADQILGEVGLAPRRFGLRCCCCRIGTARLGCGIPVRGKAKPWRVRRHTE